MTLNFGLEHNKFQFLLMSRTLRSALFPIWCLCLYFVKGVTVLVLMVLIVLVRVQAQLYLTLRPHGL